ncbi:thiamine ABC transporter substrate-binding protein [bacterium]|nr:thiamine ABC transporter substrate-binding protein [bacterium]
MMLLLLIFSLFSWSGFSLTVLSYSSFLGEGSLGESIKRGFEEKHPGVKLEFVSSKELSGLFGYLKSPRSKNVDVVIGLGEAGHAAALEMNIIDEGRVFERGPFAIVVNTEMIATKDFPQSWADLAKVLKNKLLLPDPRFSSAGEGWIRAIYEHQLISPVDSQKLVKTVYPSWSAAYSAFTKGQAPAVWSYLSSEAYHLCHDEKKFKAIPLKEGYPEQREFVAKLKRSKDANAQVFVDYVLSAEVQSKLPRLNWMFPADSETKLPNCFNGLTQVKSLKASELRLDFFQKWTDSWSLL